MQKNINTNHLLLLYTVLPLSFLFVLIDIFLDQAISQSLPKHPEEWAVWVYIFGMPHVFASFLVVADRDYLNEFKSSLIDTAIVMLIMPFAVLWWLGFEALFALFTALIVYHTIAQQFGIALIVSHLKPDITHKLNTFIASFLGVIVYGLMYAPVYFSDFFKSHSSELFLVCLLLITIVGVLSSIQLKNSLNKQGKLFIAANLLLVISIVSLAFLGYELLAIIVGRVIHEFTAWIVYAVHDHNRNSVVTHNVIYRKLSFLNISPLYFGIFLSFVLGISVTLLSDMYDHFIAMLIVSFSLYHYWIEGFIWKGRSGPRQQLVFV